MFREVLIYLLVFVYVENPTKLQHCSISNFILKKNIDRGLVVRILPLDIAHEKGPTGFQGSFVSGQELAGRNLDFFITRYEFLGV